MALRDRLLGTKYGYSTFRRVIRADQAMTVTVRDHIRPEAGQTLLDIGCGPGDLAGMLPAGVQYIGVDHNAAYLASTDLAPPSGDPIFLNADLDELGELDIGDYDVAVALGVLHHLDDAFVTSVLSTIRSQLRPGGRFVSVDPTFHPDQRASARVMMALDRGRYVRHPSDYERLARTSFGSVSVTVRHDLLPIPYSHCILEAEF